MIEVRDSQWRRVIKNKESTAAKAKREAKFKAQRCADKVWQTHSRLSDVRVRESGRYFIVSYSRYGSDVYHVEDSFRF